MILSNFFVIKYGYIQLFMFLLMMSQTCRERFIWHRFWLYTFYKTERHNLVSCLWIKSVL